MPLKALVFDAYGTLYDVHAVAVRAEAMFPGKGSAVSQLWRQKQLEYTWLRSLMGTYADFDHVTADSLRYTLSALHLAADEAGVQSLLDQYVRLTAFAEVPAALTQLKQGRKLAILSNGAPGTLNALVKNSGLAPMFDAVISVDSAGVFKPDMRIYQLAESQLAAQSPGLSRAEIGFVSSNCWDAVGAATYGYTVFWVNRLGLPADLHGTAPHHIVGGLDAIAPLLGAAS